MCIPLLISFGSYACKPEFVKATDDSDLSRLFLLDTTRQWYQDGADGYDSLEETVTGLKRHIEHLNPSSVVTIGTSMGGYAALLFGHLISADAALSFCPQTFLSHGLRDEFSDARWAQEFATIADGPYSELTAVLEGSGTHAYVLYSQDSAIDDLHALRLCRTASPKITVLGFEKMGHNTPLLLRDRGKLTPFIESVAHGAPNLPDLGPDLLISVGQDAQCERFAAMSEQRKRGQTIEDLEALVNDRPDWGYGLLLLARKRRAQGDMASAIRLLEQAVDVKTAFAEAYVDLGICRSEAGLLEQARKALDAACRYDGKRSSSQVLLAECLMHLLDFEGAAEHLKTAMRLSPEWEKPAKLLKTIREGHPAK